MNEILEIGAVKLSDDLEHISDFSCVVRSQLTGKVRNFVKELTSISNEEMSEGLPFNEAFTQFCYWLDDGNPYVIITWSNTDLYVLLENYRVFEGINTIPFLQMYADLQRYIQHIIAVPGRGQISLASACEMMSIEIGDLSLHRAPDDAALCARILKNRFDRDRFNAYISVTDSAFYGRMAFKKHFIIDLNDPDIDQTAFDFCCPQCKEPLARKGRLWLKSSAFNGRYICAGCSDEYIGTVRFRRTYDDTIIKRSINRTESRAKKTKRADEVDQAVSEQAQKEESNVPAADKE